MPEPPLEPTDAATERQPGDAPVADHPHRLAGIRARLGGVAGTYTRED